jgi:hypothetical protein
MRKEKEVDAKHTEITQKRKAQMIKKEHRGGKYM